MSTLDNTAPFLVLGGTGKTGSRVVKRLAALGHSVRIGSRTGKVPFDWNAPETWAELVEGARAVYITYQPDLAVPGAFEAVKSFVEIALKAGVKRMVLLSGRGEEEAEQVEEMFRNSGADWTIVRASWFAQNFSESFMLEAVNAGEVAMPVGDTREPFIDIDDIADVVTAALTDDRHVGKLYEVTGPRLISFPEAIQTIAAATGRPIRFQQIPAEAYRAGLEGAGVPEEMVSLVLYLFTTILDGRNAHVVDGVREALGREPRSFADYVARTAKTGIWDVPALEAV